MSLWEIHIELMNCSTISKNGKFSQMEKQYRNILSLTTTQQIPILGISSPQEFKFAPDVLSVLGKKFRFIGQGLNFEKDRIYIREQIKQVISKYGYLMVKFLVRVPCMILEGNKELIEISGRSSHHLNFKSAIKSANLLMVAVDKVITFSSYCIYFFIGRNN